MSLLEYAVEAQYGLLDVQATSGSELCSVPVFISLTTMLRQQFSAAFAGKLAGSAL